MRKFVFLFLFPALAAVLMLLPAAQESSAQCARPEFAEADAATGRSVEALLFAPDGALIVSGSFREELTVGGEIVARASADSANHYLFKYHPDTGLVWARTFRSVNRWGMDKHLAIDQSGGNIYLAGMLEDDTLDIDGVRLATEIGDDFFLLRFSPDGQLELAENYGGARRLHLDGLAAGPDGEVYFAGSYRDTAQLAGRESIAEGGRELFLLRLAQNGEPDWLATAPTPEESAAFVARLLFDDSGKLFLAGSFESEIRFGETTLTAGENLGGFYLAACSAADGAFEWAEAARSSGHAATAGLVPGEAGQIRWLLQHSDTLLVGGQMLLPDQPETEALFMAARSMDGEQLGGAALLQGDYLTDVKTIAGSEGAYYVFGGFMGDLRAGDNSLPGRKTFSDQTDMFSAAINAENNALWLGGWGGLQNENVSSAAVAPDGGVWLGGRLSQDLNGDFALDALWLGKANGPQFSLFDNTGFWGTLACGSEGCPEHAGALTGARDRLHGRPYRRCVVQPAIFTACCAGSARQTALKRRRLSSRSPMITTGMKT